MKFPTAAPQTGDPATTLLARIAQSLALISGLTEAVYLGSGESISDPAVAERARFVFAHGSGAGGVNIAITNAAYKGGNANPTVTLPYGSYYPIPAGSTEVAVVGGAATVYLY